MPKHTMSFIELAPIPALSCSLCFHVFSGRYIIFINKVHKYGNNITIIVTAPGLIEYRITCDVNNSRVNILMSEAIV